MCLIMKFAVFDDYINLQASDVIQAAVLDDNVKF